MTVKPKLLTIINRIDIGGTAVNTIPLMDALSPYFEIRIMYGHKESNQDGLHYFKNKYPNLSFIPIPSLNRGIDIFSDIKAYVFIKKYIKNYLPQIVHTHGSKAGLVGRLAAKKMKVQLVMHTFHGHLFHSYFSSFITKLIINLERYLAKRTHAIIALSNNQKFELADKYKIASSSQIQVIPLGIVGQQFTTNQQQLRAKFRNHFNLQTNDVAVALVGRVVPVKNPQLFLEVALAAIQQLKSKHIYFFIVGDGEEVNQLQQYLNDIQIKFSINQQNGAQIIFTSWYTNIEEVQNGIDILMLTSKNEGTPLSVIEAQFCGKPVIAAKVGGVQDIMQHGKTGFLVSDNVNKQEYLSYLCNMIEDENLYSQLSKQAQLFATNHFNITQQAEAVKQFYFSKIIHS